MVLVFSCLIILQFAIIACHDLIDIPGWIHGSQVQAVIGKRNVWIATLINSIFPGIAAAFAVYFWNRPAPPFVPDYWAVYCSISLLSVIGMWYVPYLLGASEKQKREYLKMYAGTRHLLPERGDHPRPNLFHIGIHVLFVVNFSLSVILWLRR